jgi:hypothetical protein
MYQLNRKIWRTSWIEVAKDLQDAEDACTTNEFQNCTANLEVFGKSSISTLAMSRQNLRKSKIQL